MLARSARACACEFEQRALTLILYVNDADWCVQRDGGALRLEPTDGSASHQIAPIGGTLVIFDSRRVWHEVLPSKRLRFAITLWVYSAPVNTLPTSPRASSTAAVPTHATPMLRAAADDGAAASGVDLGRRGPGPRSASRYAPLLTLVPDAREGRTAWVFSPGGD